MLTRRRKTVKLHREQSRFHHSNALYRGFVGGRGSGKSWVGAYDLIRRAKPKRTYLVGSPTGVKLADETYPTFKAIAEYLHAWNPSTVKLSPYPTVTLYNGAVVRFRTAEDPEKMRGPNLSGIWLDEASLMDEAAYKIAIACLREDGEQGWLSATFTPKGLGHWTYKVFGGSQPNVETFRSRTGDNPFLPAEFEQTLQQQYGSGLFADQELGGEFCNIEGAEWPPEYFGRDLWFDDWPRMPWIAKAIALDPSKGKDRHKLKEGRSADYSAFVWGASDGHTIWIDANLDNVRDASRIVQDGIGIFRGFPGCNAFVVEINQFQELLGGQFLAEAERLRIPHLPLYGYNNTANKELRIRTIGPFLAQRELRFRDTPGCQLLVQQLRDFPAGQHDDGPDALEMLLRILCWLVAGGSEDMQSPKLLRA